MAHAFDDDGHCGTHDTFCRLADDYPYVIVPTAAERAEANRRAEEKVLAAAEADPDDAYLQEVAGDIRDHREMATRRAEWAIQDAAEHDQADDEAAAAYAEFERDMAVDD